MLPLACSGGLESWGVRPRAVLRSHREPQSAFLAWKDRPQQFSQEVPTLNFFVLGLPETCPGWHSKKESLLNITSYWHNTLLRIGTCFGFQDEPLVKRLRKRGQKKKATQANCHSYTLKCIEKSVLWWFLDYIFIAVSAWSVCYPTHPPTPISLLCCRHFVLLFWKGKNSFSRSFLARPDMQAFKNSM